MIWKQTILAVLASVGGLATPALAAAPPTSTIIIDAQLPFPESISSSRKGDVFAGSIAKGNIYRAPAGANKATLWIHRDQAGLGLVTGLLADDATQTLWVCSSRSDKAAAPVAATTVKAFDLATGALRRSFAFPNEKGLCNDFAIDKAGAVYATDTDGGRIVRLAPGDSAFKDWVVDPRLKAVDGIAILDDGNVYVNTLLSGLLIRVPILHDGQAGDIVTLSTSRTLDHPDGMRALAGNQMLLVEHSGTLSRVTVAGDHATITPIRTGLAEPSAVTVVDDIAYVLESKLSFSRLGKDPGPATIVGVPLR